MIVHCRYDMTETSSIHCFTRCLTRCFGIERRTTSRTKSSAEPVQNGFIHMEDDKTNGNTVKTCEPNANGFNKQLRSVGEKTCCVPVVKSRTNETPYIYSQIPDGKMLNGDVDNISENRLLNNLNESVDKKNSIFIIQNMDTKIDQDTELVSLSNYDDQTSLIIGNSPSKLHKIDDNETPVVNSDSDKLSPYKIHIAVNNADTDDALEKDTSILPESNENKICSRTNSVSNDADKNTAQKIDSIHNEKNVKLPPLVPNGDCIIEDLETEKSVQNKVELISKEVETKENKSVTEGEHDILYFKNLLKEETVKLEKLTQKWEKVLLDQPDIHEEVCDEIRSVNGQTHLVISERFTQFRSLVEQSEQQSLNQQQEDTKIITLTDLQGFWDMIYYQVQDVLTKFQRLDRIEQNNWNPEILHEDDKKPTQKKVVKKTTNARKKGNTKSKTVAGQSNGISEEEKARRLAARKRLAEARKKMAAQNRTQNGDVIVQY